MRPEEFHALRSLEEGLWWFSGMREITSALLDPLIPEADKAVLDVGCGTGVMLTWLSRYAGRGVVVGVDIEATAVDYCKKRGHRRLAFGSADSLPFRSRSFDLVTSFDVLGQLPGAADTHAAEELWRVLRPGGTAFVRVAAYDWMRSGHDAALGTERRYTVRALSRMLENVGLHVRRATYANSVLLPLVMVRRLLLKHGRLAERGSDVRPMPPGLAWANSLLRGVLRGEAKYLRRPTARLPFGVSAICVAERDS